MTERKFLSSLALYILLLFSQNIHAQPTEYLVRFQAYFGGSFDQYQLKDPGGRIENAPISSLSGGLEVDIEYTDLFAVGGGLIYKAYSDGVNFIGGQQGAPISSQLESLQIPVYLRARTYFFKGKAQTYILGGGAWAFNLNYNTGNSRSRSSFVRNGENISYEAETNSSLEKSFPLLMAGAGADFQIFDDFYNTRLKQLRLGFSVRRFIGFTNVMRVDIDYDIDNMEFFSASQTYDSRHWMVNFHFILAI